MNPVNRKTLFRTKFCFIAPQLFTACNFLPISKYHAIGMKTLRYHYAQTPTVLMCLKLQNVYI